MTHQQPHNPIPPAQPPRKKRGFIGFLSNFKEILASAAGIITAVASLTAGAAAGHYVTVAVSAPATVTVDHTTTVTAPAPANYTPSSSETSASTVAAAPGTTYLSAIQPVQTLASLVNVTTGAEQIGTRNYPDSVRFDCAPDGSLVYDVAGDEFFDATIGVPDDATNAAGNTMSITFFKDSNSTEQLGQPNNIAVGAPKNVQINLQGATQLEIQCQATNDTTHNAASMDAALGNATLGAS